MYKLVKDDVNKKHSYTWTKLNDDSRYMQFRSDFIREFGGEFDLIQTPDGMIDEVHNFAKYCRDRELNRSAMYEVLKGKRKQYKGYRVKGD